MKKFFKVLGSIFSWILVAALVAVMVCTVISSLVIDNGNTELFGYKYFIARSNAMSPTDYKPGDLIFCEKCDASNLAVGDIITYSLYSAEGTREFVTHQIRETTFDGEGNVAFVTFSTLTGENDDYLVPAAAVVGKYMGYVSELGKFFDFVLSPAGYMAFMLVPFIIIVLIISLKYVLSVRKNNRRQSRIITDERVQLSQERAKYADAKREIEILNAKIKQMDGLNADDPYGNDANNDYSYPAEDNYAYPVYDEYSEPAPQDYNTEQYDQSAEYPQYPEENYPEYAPYGNAENYYDEQYPYNYPNNYPGYENSYVPEREYKQNVQPKPENAPNSEPAHENNINAPADNDYSAPEHKAEPEPGYVNNKRVSTEEHPLNNESEASNLREISRLLEVGQTQTSVKPAEPAAKRPAVKVKATKRPTDTQIPNPQSRSTHQSHRAREAREIHRSASVRRVRGY
ncbi:MAG: hypothetical protein K6F76_08480 [Clostridiales bacterium]|nr:hypothetical protein [Clostridiales bacterium]